MLWTPQKTLTFHEKRGTYCGWKASGDSRKTPLLPVRSDITGLVVTIMCFFHLNKNICLFEIFIKVFLVINQLMNKLFFYNKFIIVLYMFRALLCSSSRGQNCIIQHLLSHPVGGRPVRTGQPPTECDDTSYCIVRFDLLMMSTTVLETYRGI